MYNVDVSLEIVRVVVEVNANARALSAHCFIGFFIGESGVGWLVKREELKI